MDWRESLLANFAGDLEYHPRRGYLYLGLAIMSVMSWFLMPSESATLAMVFVLGGVGLFGKAIYLFRKSSEGIGLTLQDEVALEKTSKNKRLPSFASEVAQIVQDFGTSVLLLSPFLGVSLGMDQVRGNSPKFAVVVIGAGVLALGWFVRWLIRQTKPEG